MKINRLDVAHDEIIENCSEYLLISAEDIEDGFLSRAYVSTNGQVLKEIIVEEMLNSENFANFVREVINEYNQLN
tara:strand:- start:3589 stop:3813 length:225 start_codon:yes stop_codon:yes gene_type:complete